MPLDLRRKSMMELVQLWQNALAAIDDPAKGTLHRRAAEIVDDIHEEWAKRRQEIAFGERPFPWPSNDATGGSGQLRGDEWLEQGILKTLGYQVGSTEGLDPATRRRILDRVVMGHLPPVLPEVEMERWADGGSVERLRKLARTIAAFAVNAKRRSNRDSLQVAIAEWEADLDYLQRKYYRPLASFVWPNTVI
jgi:hypothetical protein